MKGSRCDKEKDEFLWQGNYNFFHHALGLRGNLDGEKLFYGASLINQNPICVKSFLKAMERKIQVKFSEECFLRV